MGGLKSVGWALVMVIPMSAAPAPDKPEKPMDEVEAFLKALATHPRLVQPIVGAGKIIDGGKQPTFPLLTVGRPLNPPGPVFTGNWNENIPYIREGDPLAPFTTGDLPLIAPSHQEPAYLYLAGPVLDMGMAWGPARLTRQGNTFTLLLESWLDDGPRRKNIPFRPFYTLALGDLPSGDYTIQVLHRSLMNHYEQKTGLYQVEGVQTATLKFSIRRALSEAIGPKTDFSSLPHMPASALNKKEIPTVWKGNRWQRPWFTGRTLDRNANPTAPPELHVGTFDLSTWLGNPPAEKPVPLPDLKAPQGTLPNQAIVLGPTLQTGEKMTLSAIEWQENHMILHVDLYRDHEPRKQNLPFQPLMVVPVGGQGGRLLPGDYEVQVRWTLLRAQTIRDPYTGEDIQRDKEAATFLETLKKRSEKKFCIK